VDGHLPQRVKSAENDMAGDPNDEKPARLVEASEHEHTAQNRERPYEANPGQSLFERTLCVALGDVLWGQVV